MWGDRQEDCSTGYVCTVMYVCGEKGRYRGKYTRIKLYCMAGKFGGN